MISLQFGNNFRNSEICQNADVINDENIILFEVSMSDHGGMSR